MGVGGVDPDSMVMVYRLGSDGKVQRTWVRHPEHPDQILIIEGRVTEAELKDPLKLVERSIEKWKL
jgi:hypothetical protein